jgi:hypothetical protein
LSAEAAALPTISRGIKLDPFTPGDISYLLWLIMGYLPVQAVLVLAWSRHPVQWAPVMIEVSGDDGGVR